MARKIKQIVSYVCIVPPAAARFTLHRSYFGRAFNFVFAPLRNTISSPDVTHGL
jgi:hypothetical protein